MHTDTPPADNPLATGNRLQRAYYRWALPHYERLGRDNPGLRERVEMADRFLYARPGLAVALAGLAAMAATAFGLQRLGLPGWLAAVLSVAGWLAVTLAMLGAWLTPEKVAAKGWPRFLRRVMLWAVLGGWFGFTVGHVHRRGGFDAAVYWHKLTGALDILLPALGGLGIGMALLMWTVSTLTAKLQQHRLARAELTAERDTARAEAAEAHLHRLQAQVQPHFVFNTLATLQHWVDKQDPRAGPLLRELTGFLRRSTEMLGRPQVPLQDEVQAMRHYLHIQQARLGERLRVAIGIAPACAAQALPPGLLLTLVENAVEHGLEPKIGGGQLQVQAACTGTGWQLRVEDDGIGLPAPRAPGTLAPITPDTAPRSVGLDNLRARLRHHYGDRATFSLAPRPAGGTCAEILFKDDPCPAS